MSYTSSIVTRYGDVENVKRDVATLHEILRRQSSTLLIDAIAESVGQVVLKFKLSDDESKAIKNSLISDLRNAIEERT